MQERAYVRIQPTTDGIDTTTIPPPFERLHALATTADAAIEWLLVSHDDQLTYYVGGPVDVRDELRATLRELFPDSYELTAEQPPLDAVFSDPTPDGGTTTADADATITESPDCAALTVQGRGERHDDWMTRLTPLAAPEDERPQPPLSAVADAMAEQDADAVYQALLDPKGDWDGRAADRRYQLEHGEDTLAQRLFKFLIGDFRDLDERPAPRGDRKRRLDQLEAVDCRHSFEVAARAVPVGPDADRLARSLRTAFHPASGRFYDLTAAVHTDQDAADDVRQAIREARLPPDSPGVLPRWLPGTSNASPRIVADPTTAPNTCLLDGATVPTAAARALDVTPDERSAVPRPTPDQLDRYRQGGLTLGCPVTQDGTADDPIALPPALQPLHVAWIGKTGSGKTTASETALLDNHAATEGATIVFAPKGDGMPREYMRAHYARYGSLEDVYYFDCTETIPAVSFYDIRPELEAGIDRSTAVADVVDHTIEILRAVMGEERFDRAVRSPDIIRYLLKALFDPVHGDDAFGHGDLMDAASRLHETRDPPPVVDEDLERMLGGVAANSRRSFDELMQGVANRIEKLPLDDRLATLFDHVPGEGDPRFDLREVLDEDCVVIVDTGGLRTESQRVLALVLLSNLWTALRRRARDRPDDAEVPLVNLYLEEAASLATTDLVSDLLAQSRSFGLSVTLAMQFPAQLRQADSEAYAEVLNNVSTIVTGNVPYDRDLAERLATADMDAEAVAARLRALSRGEWLATLPAGFGEAEPRPFTLESAPLPAGHPEGDDPLTDAQRAAFEAQYAMAADRSARQHGLAVGASAQRGSIRTGLRTAGDAPAAASSGRVDSALPYTKRLPDPVRYDADAHALVCRGCNRRHPATSDGLEDAVECCNSMDRVDRDDVPICDVPLTLGADERAAYSYTDRQFAFLQAVYAAFHGHYDPLAYDLQRDSMVRLQEYVGIERGAIQDLIDDGLVSHDGDRPHRLYTVTADGRAVLQERQRKGVTYGDGTGDLGESARHRVMVLDSADYLREEFVADPDHPAASARAYHERGDDRYDAVALDADGDIVVTLEAERQNNDLLDAVPEDFDKLARADPLDAIWVVESRAAGHEVVRALANPNDHQPRIEKTYSEQVALSKFQYDVDGLTAMYTHRQIRRRLGDD